ncbi:MAG: nickel pincer cofactor biosynthesis protein LarC [Candidatus Riflebacteria bacterium]|nr:nickel pincer cofactor biosynthesis protein LarC [Candidatus Riflebacteria bacterium]
MTNTLYWDCFSGIAGNMAVASLLDLGASQEKLQHGLASMPFSEGKIELIIEEKMVDGIRGVYFNTADDHETHTDHAHHDHEDVLGHHEHPNTGFITHEPLHEHDHQHEHGESHSHDHGHIEHSLEYHLDPEAAHGHDHEHHHHAPHRGLKDITALIGKADISAQARYLAIECFKVLAEAEAEIHGKSVDEVHFHEVGARDSIADIVGAAICLDDLNVSKVYVSPVHLGSGVVKCEHGIMPVPAPATALLLKGLPVIFDNDINFELTTPTGAALLKGFKATPLPTNQIVYTKVGHGHGSRKIGQANFLRAFLGVTEQVKKNSDCVTVLTSNIDNVSGEQLGNAIEELMRGGALDACLIPLLMKKGRPGNQLQVITEPQNAGQIEALIFSLLPTLGVRHTLVERSLLPRETTKLESSLGTVLAKKICYPDGSTRTSIEYDELIRLARQHQSSPEAIKQKLSLEFTDIT